MSLGMVMLDGRLLDCWIKVGQTSGDSASVGRLKDIKVVPRIAVNIL
jgi:hypothetical protein